MFQCVHCDEQALRPLYLPEDGERKLPFCCQGCLTVYGVLKDLSLSSYYDIKNASVSFKRRSPVKTTENTYSYLDDHKFLTDHCYRDQNGNQVMDFYLEGIHCLACLWLIEKLPQILPGVLHSKLDLEKSVASVSISDQGIFSLVARELDQLGYRPHALDRNEDSRLLKQKEERSFLMRLGVAGAAAGNIMIYSFSLYAGASDETAKIFNGLTVLLAIPVFTYSALPFYQSAWTSLKNKTISIDIPISMALLIGGMMGVRGFILNFEENYFDSLTALVFLLLLSRYFLRKIQDRGLSARDLHYFYQNESVLRQTDGGFEDTHTQYLKAGDVIKVRPDEFIPVDGNVIFGDSLLNNSLLTGESLPDHVKAGHRVFSGAQNLGADLLIEVEKISRDTRLGKILRHVEQGWAMRSRTVDLTSTVAKYFTIAVIALAAVLFLSLYTEKGMAFALTRALTLLIVTCPCALAISVPLTFHRSLTLAAQNGCIVKSDEVFEKMNQAKKIFLDKTGTITLGQLEVTEMKEILSPEISLNDIIFSLEEKSRHPVARALMEFAVKQNGKKLPVSDFREIPGKGVEGRIAAGFYSIAERVIRENGVVVANFVVKDGVRKDSADMISRFEKKNLEVALLSGDRAEVVVPMAAEVGISPAKSFSSISPEDKVRIIKQSSHSVMVGDGANDAMAIEAADVGIAVSGAMDISLRAADVYLTTPGLSGVENLFILSQETMKVVKRNLILSLVYNTVSVFFVFSGVISPLVAAVVMPVSSLTVLLSTLLGTGKMRSLWKS
jgi:heavy metal-(Cd/Co/Hg/Pb/Zn)-translocating P-type ATPase